MQLHNKSLLCAECTNLFRGGAIFVEIGGTEARIASASQRKTVETMYMAKLGPKPATGAADAMGVGSRVTERGTVPRRFRKLKHITDACPEGEQMERW